MDKDRAKGEVNDAAGRVKRQVGEWTDNPNAQAEGTMQQVKGKVQKVWSSVKDAARDANAKTNREHGTDIAQEHKSETEPEHAHSGQQK